MAPSSRDDDFSAYQQARWATMVRSAVLLGCSPHEAEDIAQTALARCYVHWSKIAAARDPDAYAYRILVNTLGKARRRRWTRERPEPEVSDSISSGDLAGAVALRQLVLSSIRGLSHQQREVIVLKFFVDMSDEQIADCLTLPLGTVKSRTRRALAKLAADSNLITVHNRQEQT